jgi:hypothetical protein
MTSHSISEGFAEDATVATLGKPNSMIDSVGGSRIVLLNIYSIFLAPVQDFLNRLERSKKRLNETPGKGIFTL